MNKKFKVGDEVRISKSREEFGEYNFYFDKGDIVKIISDYGDGDVECKRKKDGMHQTVPITCLEPLNNAEIQNSEKKKCKGEKSRTRKLSWGIILKF